MRLFVAVYPTAEALDDLAARVSSLPIAEFGRRKEVNVRLADRALWHLTLAFLGEVPDGVSEDVAAAIDAAAADTAAPPPDLRLAGGGTFGRGRFTTLWVGLAGAGPGPGLDGIAVAVTTQLRRARLPYDRKPFRAHLTIARPGDRVPRPVLDESMAALNAYAGPAWAARELCLVSSKLGPKPVHEVIHRAQLTD